MKFRRRKNQQKDGSFTAHFKNNPRNILKTTCFVHASFFVINYTDYYC